MSQEAYTCIEQLDLAAQQLEKRNPSYARFAIILIDNVVELIAQRICNEEVRNDDFWIKLGRPKLSNKQRQNALGQRFDKKILFCRSMDKLSADQADAIQICHKYRNELYHTGLKYQNVIWDIAHFYYDIATSVLAEKYSPGYWSSSSIVSPAVERHAGKQGKLIGPEMNEVANSLQSIKPKSACSLREALSKAAIERVKEVQDSLDFLVSDGPMPQEENRVLKEVQFHNWLRSDDPIVLSVWEAAKSHDQMIAARSFLETVWKPRHVVNPLPMFETQANSIACVKSELIGLKTFERFRSDFSYISEILEQAAYDLDAYIQSEIDRMRGK